jgi:hypothetical protein
MKQDNIHIKITEALNSLDGSKRAEANPYLTTRINAKISALPGDSAWSKVWNFMSKPYFAMFGLLFVMLINLVILFSGGLRNNNNTTVAGNSSGVYEMAINISSNYDLENQEP